MVGVLEDVAEVARWAKGIFEGVHECIAGTIPASRAA